jgi:hypothetical protein
MVHEWVLSSDFLTNFVAFKPKNWGFLGNFFPSENSTTLLLFFWKKIPNFLSHKIEKKNKKTKMKKSCWYPSLQ